MVWELLPAPFSGFRDQHGVGAVACALFREGPGCRPGRPDPTLHRHRELRCLMEKIIPEMMFGIGAERIHQKWQSTCYSSVLGLVGPRYLAQEGQIPDMVCALFREWPAWCGSCCLLPFQGLGTSMVWELLPVPFSGRGLVAGQEGLIQLCTGTGNSGA